VLWVFQGSMNPCLGKVGTSNSAKMCIRPCAEGFENCGTARHSVKHQVERNCAYIRLTDNQVLVSPVWNLAEYSEDQVEQIKAIQFSAGDWGKEFKIIDSGEVPDWLQLIHGKVEEEASLDTDQVSVQLLSPMAAASKQGVFELVPNFSFDSTNTEDEGGDEDKDEMQARLVKVESKLGRLKDRLSRPFRDIDASYSVMVNDLQKLHDRVKTLTLVIGPFPAADDLTHTNLSQLIKSTMDKVHALDEFKTRLQSLMDKQSNELGTLKQAMDSLREEMAELQEIPLQLDQWVQSSNRTFETFNRRFAAIKTALSIRAPEFGNKENE
jgi:archaellum component FlaC